MRAREWQLRGPLGVLCPFQGLVWLAACARQLDGVSCASERRVFWCYEPFAALVVPGCGLAKAL